MKSQISSVDLHYLIKEMQFLIGARVDQIYHPKKEELLIQFHVTSKGKKVLRIISGKFIFLSEIKENIDAPSGFCMFLRKHLANSRLKEISQIASERIAKLSFETREETVILYIELFGKGNIVLTDDKDMIINALEQRKWSDREVRKGLIYKYSAKEFNLFDIKKKDIENALRADKEIVLILAKDIGIGGTYAEEVLARLNIEKKKKNVSEKDKIYSALKELINKEIKSSIIVEDGKIRDVLPFEMDIYKDSEKKYFESFNEAFDYLFKEEYAEKFVSKHQGLIDKTKKIIEQQKKQLEETEKKAAENNRKGELIYENYKLVEEILNEINKARVKYSFDEIREKLKGHKIIKSVDPKNKKVTIQNL